jgi:hypothetical protein
MKRQYKILLSDEAIKIVKEKSKIFKLPMYSIIESMIMEFSPSTIEERQSVKAIYNLQLSKFVKENPNATLKQAFRHGYHWGWKLFQVRKETSMYEKYKKKLKKVQ